MRTTVIIALLSFQFPVVRTSLALSGGHKDLVRLNGWIEAAAGHDDVDNFIIDFISGKATGEISIMSLLAMDTSSLFDPFEFPLEMDLDPPKPETKFREKLEIKTTRHQDHHLKVRCTCLLSL